jgi:hypothetical protein
VDDKKSPPADSNDASGTSGDVDSMLPDLPEPEVPPQGEAVAAKGEEETGEEETEDTGGPATLELTTAARGAKAALDAEKEEEEPKAALPMQKPAPKWAQTSPVAEEEAAESQEDGDRPAAARPMQKPTPEWAKTVPETAVPVTEAEAPIDPDAKLAVPMAKEAPK